jgi:hypothetical protein
MLTLKITQSALRNRQIFITQFHFGQNSSVIRNRGKGNRRHSAPAQYTLCAWKEKNQISQAQFRAKSGAPASLEDGEIEEENSRAGELGKAQAMVAGAMREIWF